MHLHSIISLHHSSCIQPHTNNKRITDAPNRLHSPSLHWHLLVANIHSYGVSGCQSTWPDCSVAETACPPSALSQSLQHCPKLLELQVRQEGSILSQCQWRMSLTEEHTITAATVSISASPAGTSTLYSNIFSLHTTSCYSMWGDTDWFHHCGKWTYMQYVKSSKWRALAWKQAVRSSWTVKCVLVIHV